jgi:glutamate 5-kinase
MVLGETQIVGQMKDAVRAAGEAGSLGTGGMRTKLEAAGKAAAAGIDTALFCGRNGDVIAALAGDRLHGTFIEAHGDRLLARKLWLRHAPTGLNGVRIDAGAAQALGARGASLLPGGVTAVEGEFGRGDLIEVRLAGDAGNAALARGLAQYNSADLRRIAGRHSRDIEAILGYRYGEAVIHRDDLVVLPLDAPAQAESA